MEYIDADKLKALVRRQIHWENLSFAALGGGGQTFCTNTLEWILKQIDSLQQEQPEIDLEKKIQDWCKENVTGVKPIYTADSLIYDLLPKTAHHFYELGLNARKEE